MGTRVSKYFSDSYSELVCLDDGVPVQYCSQAPSLDKKEEPALAQAIEQLTGKRVRFGQWKNITGGDPRDDCAEVDLLPALADGHHMIPDRFGESVVIEGGRPVRFTCLGSALGEAEAHAAAERIAALTCFRVRFTTWRDTPQSAQEGGAECDLVVVEEKPWFGLQLGKNPTVPR